MATQQWACEICDTCFDNEEEALSCEQQHLNEKIDNDAEQLLQSVFPTSHNSDTRYEYHCVLCGKLIMKYDTVWDGHRNERGDLIYDNGIKFMEGYYCSTCVIEGKNRLQNAVKFLHDQLESEKELDNYKVT